MFMQFRGLESEIESLREGNADWMGLQEKVGGENNSCSDGYGENTEKLLTFVNKVVQSGIKVFVFMFTNFKPCR